MRTLKKLLLFLVVATGLFVTSCSDNEVETYEELEAVNATAPSFSLSTTDILRGCNLEITSFTGNSRLAGSQLEFRVSGLVYVRQLRRGRLRLAAAGRYNVNGDNVFISFRNRFRGLSGDYTVRTQGANGVELRDGAKVLVLNKPCADFGDGQNDDGNDQGDNGDQGGNGDNQDNNGEFFGFSDAEQQRMADLLTANYNTPWVIRSYVINGQERVERAAGYQVQFSFTRSSVTNRLVGETRSSRPNGSFYRNSSLNVGKEVINGRDFVDLNFGIEFYDFSGDGINRLTGKYVVSKNSTANRLIFVGAETSSNITLEFTR